MNHEDIQREVDIQKMEARLAHNTLQGQWRHLHEALEEFVDAVQDSFPKVL